MALLKTIADRVRSFRALENAVTHHGQRVAKILDERYNSLLPESMRIDFLAFMQGILEIVRDASSKLTTAERKHVDEQADDVRQRQERDTDMDELSTEIVDARDAFVSVYKPPNVEEYGFPKNIGRPAVDLLRQGDHLAENLERSDLTLPTARFGAELPVASLLKPVKTKLEKLRRSVTAVDRERKEAEIAQVEKDRAAEYYDLLLLWGARMLEGLFTMAGEDELAGRVRPSTRRPGRTEAVEKEEEQDSGEAAETAESPA